MNFKGLEALTATVSHQKVMHEKGVLTMRETLRSSTTSWYLPKITMKHSRRKWKSNTVESNFAECGDKSCGNISNRELYC